MFLVIEIAYSSAVFAEYVLMISLIDTTVGVMPDLGHEEGITLWQGLFTSFDEAKDACGNGSHKANWGSTAYSSQRWFKNLENLLSIAKKGVVAKPSRLPELVEQLHPEVVIDLGGGNGWLSYLLPTWFTGTSSSYIVVEPELLIDELRRIGGQRCLSWLPSENPKEWSVLPQPKILYSLSMLQYVGDFSILESLIEFHQPLCIFLEDVPCSRGKQFFTLQNYYEFKIPYRFISVDDLQTTLIKFGYKLEESFNYEAIIDSRVQLKIEGHNDAIHQFGGFKSFRFSLLKT